MGTQPAPYGFQKRDYFHGLQLEMPSGGGGELLVRDAGTPAPTDGAAYPWMTEGQIHVSCLATIDNATGQGFLAVTPDGTRVWFEWMAQQAQAPLRAAKFTNAGTSLHWDMVPQKTSLYATRVQDRFGNWVQYSYSNAWNEPVELTSITSSDGRTLTVAYAGGRIASVSDGARTWQYQYGTTSSGRDTLTAVVLPDASRWTIDFADLTNAELLTTEANAMVPGEIYRTCRMNELPLNLTDADPGNDTAVGSVTHPSGATGTFTLDIQEHGLSHVPVSCGRVSNGDTGWVNGNNPNDDVNLFAMKYYGFTLTDKTITGPGLPAATAGEEALAWTYAYSPNLSWFFAGDATRSYPVCTLGAACHERRVCDGGPCEGAAITTVNGPDGAWERYTFGNSFKYNEGKLLKVERGSGPAAILETTVNTYDLSLVDQVYPARFGISRRGSNDFAVNHHRPLVRRDIIRQGETFTWQVETCGAVYCTDAQAHPERIRRHSTQGVSRTETTAYWNDFAKWIIGRPMTVTCVAATPASADCDGNDVMSAIGYGPLGQPVTQSAFGALQYTLGYHADGTLATFKDPNHHVTTLSSWYRGVPRLIQYPDGASVSATVNGTGTLASTTGGAGHKTCYVYDPMGRLTQVTYPSETQPGVCDTSRWNPTTQAFVQVGGTEYGIGAGHWRQTVQTGNGVQIRYFDALWRPLVVREYDAGDVSGTQRFTRLAYDHAGRTTFASYPGTGASLSLGTRTVHDALGRIDWIEQDTDLGVLTTDHAYAPTAFETTVTNPRGHATTTAFQGWDAPVTDFPVRIAQPEDAVTATTRDPYGKPLAITRGNSAGTVALTRTLVYDDPQRLCKTIEPETGATVFAYDPAGNLAWSASGQDLPNPANCDHQYVAPGQQVQRTYDARNRLSTLRFPDGLGDQDWIYTADGLPDQITTWNGANQTVPVINAYSYNARRMLAGQGESISQPGWYTWAFGYGYDRNGHLAANTYPSGLVIDYLPNALGQPTQAGTFATNARYHPNGALKQFTYGNGIVHTTSQTVRGLPEVRCDAYGGACGAAGATAVVFDTHAYDQNANLIAITDGTTATQRGNRDMVYDGLDRLRTAVSPMFGTARYGFDVLDNLTTVKVTGGTSPRDHAYHYTLNRLSSVTDNATGATVIGLAHDVRGNLANKNGVLYDFDFGNRLRTVVGQESYRYDGLGRRVLAWSAQGLGNLLSQYDRAGRLVYQHDARTYKGVVHVYLADRLVARRVHNLPAGSDPTVTYLHTDALGSPVVATDAGRTEVQRSEYEPFGLLVNRANDNRPGFTGHVMDAVTGLTYMEERYYDSELGLFLSVDPVTAFDSGDWRQFNRYAYAYNNPYRFTDPDGRSGVAFLGGLIMESWNAVNGRGFDGGMVLGALKDGYNGEGGGVIGAIAEDASAISIIAGGAGALRAAGALAARHAAKSGIHEGAETMSKGLGNPFKGKTPEQIDTMMRGKGYESRGQDPLGGKGGYVNPKTGRSYHIDPKPRTFKKTGVEKPHVDVNRSRGYQGALEKKKYPLE